MNTNTTLSMLSGAIIMGFFAIGLFFIQFWRQSRDSLFIMFALAFWVFGVERFVIHLISPEYELRPLVYLTRIVGYVLIVIGIVYKNMPKGK